MNVIEAVEALGIEIRKSNSYELGCSCPFHSPDRKPSFYINLSTGAWICHTGCDKGRQLATLVRKVKGISSREAYEWLEQKPPSSSFPTTEDIRKKLHRGQEASSEGPRRLPPYIDTQVPRWTLERGFTKEILRQHKLGYDAVLDSLVIPVLQAKALIYRRAPGQTPTYKYSEGFKAHNTFYGLDQFFKLWEDD